MQVALLAASWHLNAKHFAPLEVLHIGPLPDHLAELFSELGAASREVAPNQNDTFSKTANAIQGAERIPGEQILLVDNDVYLHGDISPLGTLPANSFYGCPENGPRIEDKHWEIIRKELNLHPLVDPFLPANSRFRLIKFPLKKGKFQSQVQQCVYVNGGVVLIPPDYDMRENWQKHQKRINDFFEDHPFKKGYVTSSNMAALSTCIGDYGTFSWLPDGYNYRWSSFTLGLCSLDNIKIVHMTGDPITQDRHQKEGVNEETITLKERIQHWWKSKIDNEFEGFEKFIGQDEWDRRMNISHQVRDSAISVAEEYNLDALLP